MMVNRLYNSYDKARRRAQEAIQLCLEGELYVANERLQHTRNELKHLSGDLPIVGHDQSMADSSDTPFVTQTFVEAQAWGWLELASGVYRLMQDRPGVGMMHFSRAWRIWRPWSIGVESAQKEEAIRECIRTRLWLGEAWARFMSDRAQRAANAILRTALTELRRIGAHHLLQETIAQQNLLPAAPPGSPAYSNDGRTIPYIRSLLTP